MTESKRDSLAARIARGEADPITPAEREIAQRIRESIHEKYDSRDSHDGAINNASKRRWYQFWR